jgi:hypothetical protein
MHVNSWFRKPYDTQNIMACHDKYWCHKFKTQKLMVLQKSWIAMKIYDTLLSNGMPFITWKIKLLLIAKDNNIFN